MEDFEKERAFMRQQWERASAEMQSEVSGYKKLVEVRMQHRKSLHVASQRVLALLASGGQAHCPHGSFLASRSGVFVQRWCS